METLVHIQGSSQSRLTPLFLVHAISGLALPYLGLGNLSDNADEDVDNSRIVYGISSPTYQYRSYQLPHTLEDIAREYINLIQREVQPEGPYLLGGWSMGGTLAMKMAGILESQGEDVLHVLLLDSANPESIPPFVDPKEHELITSLTYENVAKHMSLTKLANPNTSGSGSVSEDEGDEGDDAEGVSLDQLLPRMRKHIFNGLNLISMRQKDQILQEPLQSPVTLIKCASLLRFHQAFSDARKEVVRKNFQDDRSGWLHRMVDLRTIWIDAQHDNMLDKKHIDTLTAIMRCVLKDVN